MVYNQPNVPPPCSQTFTGLAICQAVKPFLLRVRRYAFLSELVVRIVNRKSKYGVGNKVLSKCR